MLDLQYSLTIEATSDPEFFGFFSEELQGFSGIGHSIEDCLYRARHGMRDHVATMRQMRLKPPRPNRDARVTIMNMSRKARYEPGRGTARRKAVA
jgi:predicted RNase H-like HicB family nuclease